MAILVVVSGRQDVAKKLKASGGRQGRLTREMVILSLTGRESHQEGENSSFARAFSSDSPMPIQTLLQQNRNLIHQTLRDQFGLASAKCDQLLESFALELEHSEKLQQELAVSGSSENALLLAIRNHAFRQLAHSGEAGRQFHSSVDSSSADSPRFSASETDEADIIWALQRIAPAMSLMRDSAPQPDAWRLFEESQIRPLFTGRKKPPISSVATSLGYQSTAQAENELMRETRRWLSILNSRIRSHCPPALPPTQAEKWVGEQHRSLARVLQKIVGANLLESQELLRRVQKLLPSVSSTKASEEELHFAQGLRMWESLLCERIAHWHEPRYVYDVHSILDRERLSASPHVSLASNVEHAALTRPPRSSNLPESTEQILANLQMVLQQPLPCNSDLFMAEYFADPATPFNRGMTIEQLLFANEPPEHGLRVLKDVAKQQGQGTTIVWHLAVAKLIYFAAIAAYIVHVNPRPARITSLSTGELRHALHWAASLPQVDTRITTLFEQAIHIIDRYASESA